ncbi:TetR/AcrR family transcriptional regulator [Nocardia sp. NPDC050712]|uniref:TetR/AcrR family transcriptional regulator n=1 Tax=Nocardia sp. NPDC050712 TaxID=3155518 RepID=UPI0033DCFEB1
MATPGDAAIPKSLALLWGLDVAGERGPKRGLSLDRILDTAIEVGDAEGLSAISMGRIAKELGFTAMSLYRYVDSKQTLFEMLLDRAIGLPPEIVPGAGWRENLKRWALAEYESIERHPWWLDIPMNDPPMGPNNMAWLETGLAALGETRVPPPIRMQLVMNLTFYVMGRARVGRSINPDEGDDEDYDAVLARLIDPQRFPHVLAAFARWPYEDDEIDWQKLDFDFGLERMLDGYASFIRSFET